MKAVILAGGKGTRLENLTREIPKPMIHVGDKSVLQHQIELLKKYNITEIIILVNYLKDAIINYFGNGEKFGTTISYYEEKEPLGTVGGIKEIESQLTEDFIVLYGDVMMNMDLQRLMQFHTQKQSQCTLVLHPNDHPYDSDLVEIDNHSKITAFHSKPHPHGVYYRNLVNAGAYVMNPILLKYLNKGEKADFGKDIFPKLYDKINFFGYNTTEYLKDMGTPDRLEKVNKDYKSGKIERSSYEYKQRAIFLDRDGVLNEDLNLIHKPEDLQLFDFTAEAIKKINRSEYVSIVVTNQSVVARNLCTIDELEYIHKKLDTILGDQRAKLDAIYYCPHHPDKGFPEENLLYKIDCDCRKPKSGMLKNAAIDFNIDLKSSFLIGDSETDILCAENAEVTSIGVMTGKGLKKSSVRPDYFFPTLKEAVDFVVSEPLKEIAEKISSIQEKQTKKPFVLAVGGNARSGKSTLAVYLKKYFESQEKKVMRIELDDWLLPKGERENAANVFERFQIDKIKKNLKEILSGKKVTTPGYTHHADKKRDNIEYQYNNEEIVIIEGIVALSNPEIRAASNLRIFADIKDDTLKDRFFHLYRWKGMKEEEIQKTFASRKEDEYKLIKNDARFADLVI